MRTLQDEVQKRGFKVAHIKTDSIKIPDATPEIIAYCMDFAKKYGYTFEHEATYERMCLVNNAVYIAKYMTADQCEALYGYIPDDCKDEGGEWTATAHSSKCRMCSRSLFSKEKIEFTDLCETKTVSKALSISTRTKICLKASTIIFLWDALDSSARSCRKGRRSAAAGSGPDGYRRTEICFCDRSKGLPLAGKRGGLSAPDAGGYRQKIFQPGSR